LFLPRIQFIARPIVDRPAFASQAVLYDKAGASVREILMCNMEENSNSSQTDVEETEPDGMDSEFR